MRNITRWFSLAWGRGGGNEEKTQVAHHHHDLSLSLSLKKQKKTAGLIFHPFYIPRVSQWLGSQRHPTSHFINISLPDLSLQSTSFFPFLVSFLPSIFFSAGSRHFSCSIAINPSVWLHYLYPPPLTVALPGLSQAKQPDLCSLLPLRSLGVKKGRGGRGGLPVTIPTPWGLSL